MYADVEGMTAYYEEHGQPSGPPLVLLHGFTTTGRLTWDEHLAALGAEYRLVVPDLRGHGLTDNPAGPSAMNIYQFTRDVSTFCDQVGIERAAFCGYSAGAVVAIHLALSRPELVEAAVLAAATFTIPEVARAAHRDMSVLDLAHAWFGPPGDAAEPYPPVFAVSHRALGPDHWQTVMGDFIALFGRTDGDDYPDPDTLPQLRAPVLVLHGDRDTYFPVEIPVELYRRFPDAELGILPQIGHDLVEAQPELFRSFVLDFLARRYPAPSS